MKLTVALMFLYLISNDPHDQFLWCVGIVGALESAALLVGALKR